MPGKPPNQLRKCQRCGSDFALHPSTPPNQVTTNLCPPCIAEMLQEMLKRSAQDD